MNIKLSLKINGICRRERTLLRRTKDLEKNEVDWI
jgi:hypothetical protein